jgi:hypothetical protein
VGITEDGLVTRSERGRPIEPQLRRQSPLGKVARRAAKELKIIKERPKGEKVWWWSLPKREEGSR